MASVILYCGRCFTGYASIGEIPVKCPACDRVTRWTTSLPLDRPKVPFALTLNDRRFLRSLRIDPEVPDAS